MRTRTDVVFHCWRCGQKISVPDNMQGKLLPCPGCERLLTVPPGADVPKRIVPIQDVGGVVASAKDVTFDCVHCDFILVADKRGAGMTLACPGCGKPVTVPQPKEASLPQPDGATPSEPVLSAQE